MEAQMATRSRSARRILVPCALAVVPLWAGAQQQPLASTTLVGSVRDSAGRAVPGAELRIAGRDVLARTNDAGGFRIAAAPVGKMTIAVRRMGFAPLSTDVTLRAGRIDSLVVSLVAVATDLPGVVVEDEATLRSKKWLAGFWERRSRGFGSYMTRSEIEARHANNFVDVVRMVPSTAITYVNGRQAIRFRRFPGLRDCPPQYWLDGQRVEQASPDEFTPEDVEAIEIYPGPATVPVQFAPRPNTNVCGAIIIWTRVPG
jgi:hypothetical protein